MLLAVALQEEQVRALEEGAAHGVLVGLLSAPGHVRQGGGWAQAGLTDCAAQSGLGGAPGSHGGQGWGSFRTDPLQPPGLRIYP